MTPAALPPVFDLMPGVRRPTETKPFAELHAPRVRTLLHRSLGGEWPGPGYIGLVAPKAVKQEAIAMGAEVGEFNRLYVERSKAVDPKWQPFLPLIARKHFVPLCVDMIPESSFGASLKNLLTDECWALIRREAYRSSGHVCSCCGEASGPLECHEVWDFDDETEVDGWHTQSLKHLLPVCAPCHMIFHPGLANIRGLSDQVQDRVQKINIWKAADYNLHAGYSNRMHRIRSRQRWCLDFSSVDLPVLQVRDDWGRLASKEVLSIQLRTGRCTTRIVGADYTHQNATHSLVRSPGL